MELGNILLCKNYEHSNTIIEKAKHANRITVVGAGYIGVELVEAFEQSGKRVTLIDSADRILNRYLDGEFSSRIEDAFRGHGIELALGQTVKAFEGKDGLVSRVITDKGEIETDMVILCIGFRPNTELLKGQVDMLPGGAIIVDPYMQTSKKDVFAVERQLRRALQSDREGGLHSAGYECGADGTAGGPQPDGTNDEIFGHAGHVGPQNLRSQPGFDGTDGRRRSRREDPCRSGDRQ